MSVGAESFVRGLSERLVLHCLPLVDIVATQFRLSFIFHAAAGAAAGPCLPVLEHFALGSCPATCCCFPCHNCHILTCTCYQIMPYPLL